MRGIWRRTSDRPKWVVEAAIGLLMIPLTAVPIVLYLSYTDDGYLMYLRGRYAIAAPSTPDLSPEARAAARRHARTRRGPGIPVLVYHGVGRTAAEAAGSRFVVSRWRFAEQMHALRAAGYRPVSTSDVARFVRRGDARRLPRRPVLVTFDDGRTDAMIQADPILRDTGMRATMFVIGEAASGQSFYYQGWDRLQEYVASGRWELGNHTDVLHHVADGATSSALATLEPGETIAGYGERLRADLRRAQEKIAARTGAPAVAFAYPFGDWGERARRAVSRALKRVLGREFAVAFDQDFQEDWRFALPGDDPLHVHRLEVENWSVGELLARLAAGARRAVRAAR